MTGALIILGVLVVTGALLYLFDRAHYKGRPQEDTPAAGRVEKESNGECCGQHILCEKDSLSPFTTEAEYYDDEELDRFRGRESDSYSAEEEEEFRNILLTMATDEIAGWVRSLTIRQVELPAEIRTEVLLILREEREKKNSHSIKNGTA